MRQSDLLPIAAIITMFMLMVVLIVIDTGFYAGERYTELFFSGEDVHEISFNETTPLTFTIANHEGRSMLYNYVIKVGGMTVDSGFMDIGPGESGQKTVSYKLMQIDTPTKVSVSLRERVEEIHIWVIAR